MMLILRSCGTLLSESEGLDAAACNDSMQAPAPFLDGDLCPGLWCVSQVLSEKVHSQMISDVEAWVGSVISHTDKTPSAKKPISNTAISK